MQKPPDEVGVGGADVVMGDVAGGALLSLQSYLLFFGSLEI